MNKNNLGASCRALTRITLVQSELLQKWTTSILALKLITLKYFKFVLFSGWNLRGFAAGVWSAAIYFLKWVKSNKTQGKYLKLGWKQWKLKIGAGKLIH